LSVQTDAPLVAGLPSLRRTKPDVSVRRTQAHRDFDERRLIERDRRAVGGERLVSSLAVGELSLGDAEQEPDGSKRTSTPNSPMTSNSTRPTNASSAFTQRLRTRGSRSSIFFGVKTGTSLARCASWNGRILEEKDPRRYLDA
jgi:hypothetical protein